MLWQVETLEQGHGVDAHTWVVCKTLIETMFHVVK